MSNPEADEGRTGNLACAPGPSLAGSVALLWSHRASPGAPVRRELSLPEGTVELVLNLSDASEQGMLVCGPHSRPFLAETLPGASLLAVHFYPGEASPFFDLPLTELHNRIAPLETLWGPYALELRDRLWAAPPETRVPLLENALNRRGRSPSRPPRAITHALRRLGREPNARIADLAETIGWSERHFNRVFREQVGLSPKLYGRLRRFQAALRQIPTGVPVHWAELAQTCGYFDQAHLVHEFRDLSGVTPTTYQTQRDRHANHLPV